MALNLTPLVKNHLVILESPGDLVIHQEVHQVIGRKNHLVIDKFHQEVFKSPGDFCKPPGDTFSGFQSPGDLHSPGESPGEFVNHLVICKYAGDLANHLVNLLVIG